MIPRKFRVKQRLVSDLEYLLNKKGWEQGPSEFFGINSLLPKELSNRDLELNKIETYHKKYADKSSIQYILGKIESLDELEKDYPKLENNNSYPKDFADCWSLVKVNRQLGSPEITSSKLLSYFEVLNHTVKEMLQEDYNYSQREHFKSDKINLQKTIKSLSILEELGWENKVNFEGEDTWFMEHIDLIEGEAFSKSFFDRSTVSIIIEREFGEEELSEEYASEYLVPNLNNWAVKGFYTSSIGKFFYQDIASYGGEQAYSRALHKAVDFMGVVEKRSLGSKFLATLHGVKNKI